MANYTSDDVIRDGRYIDAMYGGNRSAMNNLNLFRVQLADELAAGRNIRDIYWTPEDCVMLMGQLTDEMAQLADEMAAIGNPRDHIFQESNLEMRIRDLPRYLTVIPKSERLEDHLYVRATTARIALPIELARIHLYNIPRISFSELDLLDIVAIGDHKEWDEKMEHDHSDISSAAFSEFDPNMKAEVNWIFTATEYLDWRDGETPCILLVDGCPSKHNAPMTLMSVASARIYPALCLEKSGGFNTHLSFFAENYCNTEESARNENGPKALLRGLTSQLISASFHSSFVLAGIEIEMDFLTPGYEEALERYDLGFLCKLFDDLVQKFPPKSEIYCIIDGISLWEQEPWIDDLRIVISMFEDIVERQRKNPERPATLRVLMGSPGKSTVLVEKTKNQDQNSIWKDVSLDGYTPGSIPPTTWDSYRDAELARAVRSKV